MENNENNQNEKSTYSQFNDNRNISSEIKGSKDYAYTRNYLNDMPDKPNPIFRIGKVILSLVLAALIFAGGYAFGRKGNSSESITGINNSKTAGSDSKTVSGGQSHITTPANWEKLDEIRTKINQLYLFEIDDNKLLEGAIKGMVNALGDPYTVFYNPTEFKQIIESNQGKFVGVGIQVSPRDGYITVVSPIEGGPAKEAGILAGDKIYKINGTVYTDEDMEKAVGVMRGKEGEEVTLTILRNDKEMEFKVIRREIKVSSVTSEMVDADTGMIILSQFNEGTAKEFKAALENLKSKGMKGLILDLRGNPGGYMNECIDIASNFIEKGQVVVYQVDKNGRKVENKSNGGSFIGLPMVVLIDGGSASASEVLTGALIDYKTATVIGTKSFGKGIVQSIFEVGEGAGLKVTTASFYSPNGTNIHKTGIVPEINVEYPEELRSKPYDRNTDPQFKKALEVLKTKLKN